MSEPPPIDDEFWADEFHTIAFWAYYHQAAVEGRAPDCENTRRRAYRYYERIKRGLDPLG